MLFTSFAALLAVTTLGVSASPLDKRQDASTTATRAEASAISTTAASSSTRAVPSAGLIIATNSDGQPTTIVQDNPNAAATTTGSATSTATGTSGTGQPIPPASSKDFPYCTDEDAKPFCLPSANDTLYVGETYYVTWNPKFFPSNTTVTIRLIYNNASTNPIEAWHSDSIDVSYGFDTVTMQKEWLQGAAVSHLRFVAVGFQANRPDEQAAPYDGPNFDLMNRPPKHLPAESSSKFNKEGLLIGLPVGLGALAFVMFGLFWGMRKQRQIGLGNIMSRKRHGYGAGKSKRQRLGLGSKKQGAIRLEERELNAQPTPQRLQYRDDRFEETPLEAPRMHGGHSRDESLGSLVSEDEPRSRNAFRDEIRRQQTGR